MNYVSSSSELGDQTKLSEYMLYLKVILIERRIMSGHAPTNVATKEG